MKATSYQGNKTFSVIDRELQEPMPGEVRIKVAYSGVCGTDVHIYHGMMDKRVKIPETIGHEMSGTIDALGQNGSGFALGEKVVVRPLDDRGAKPSDKG
ncbi:MAG: alcohol dehydrogenase catalytic domain-containing protein, partial [Aurantibacter sp.]